MSYNIRRTTQADTRRFGITFSAAEITSFDETSESKTSRKVEQVSSSIIAFVGDGVRIRSPAKQPFNQFANSNHK